MTFNSITFAVFFIMVLAVYWNATGRGKNLTLVFASYVFYGWWDWRFLSLLLISTAIDFTIGKRLDNAEHDGHRKFLVWSSVAVNLGILATFKYFGFFSDSAERILETLGFDASFATLNVLLPVGISFYTFQTMSYTLDVYRRRIEPTNDIVAFATYVAYFPQLVAGPIERAQNLLPAIVDVNRSFPDAYQRREAFRLILVGLAKKVVLADGVASIANRAFDESSSASWIVLAIGVIAFAIQIYGDFSGYTDIARGVSKLLGIDLVLNFSEPYLSRNITEFWRRWHISLSNWLRDYLYISLGGNRKGVLNTYRNLLITMLLGGLWHGASWNFVIWGGLHGLYLVIHKLTRGGAVPTHEPRLRDLPSIACTLAAVLLAWVFFRADTFQQAVDVIGGLLTMRGGPVRWTDVGTIAVFSSITVWSDLAQRRHSQRHQDPSVSETASLRVSAMVGRGAGAAILITAIVVFSGGTPVPFIYFQF